MENKKKVLVLGGTGAMGVYLVPELLGMGYQVDVVSLDEVESNQPELRYIRANAQDDAFLRELLKNKYDGIVDFMFYGTEHFRARHEELLANTGHYIFLSSYRVYAGDTPLREDSPQLLDVSEDREFLASDDYALAKCREEDILQASPLRNWTIVRPAITFSKFRFQLVTLEANALIPRARAGKTVILPEAAKSVQATMTWAGDVAKMQARLLMNEKAYGECYTVSTAEHNTWETVAGYYQELLGLKVKWVDQESYLRVRSAPGHVLPARWQLDYDRLFHRAVDNRKILAATGLRQEDFMPLKEGLRRELSALPDQVNWPDDQGLNDRMDAYLAGLNA